jgi:outer membrane murein-binding lipoprotein Lpp
MVIFRSLVLMVTLAAFLCIGMACSSKEPSNTISSNTEESQPAAAPADQMKEQPVAAAPDESQAAGEQAQQAEPAAPAEAPKTLALTGTIAQEGDDIMLVTDLGDYVVAGQDLSTMVGKSVNVTGAVEEVGGKYTINVISFSEN